MALQPVNVGTIPNDGTGDDPRTGISKVNANMVLLEATGVNGVDNVFTEVNYKPDEKYSLGAKVLMKNDSGGTIALSGSIAGSSLKEAFADTLGVITASGETPSGTWQNTSDLPVGNGFFNLFTRTA